jgi:hypothetical protein
MELKQVALALNGVKKAQQLISHNVFIDES